MPLRAALGVAGDQGVLAGAGAVHPVQRARHAQPGLIEPGHLGVARSGRRPRSRNPSSPSAARAVIARHGALGDRGAEQLGQRLRGALLRQELPDIEVEHDRGDPRPVLHRRAHTLRRGAAGGGPAPTAAGDELVFDRPAPSSAADRTPAAAPSPPRARRPGSRRSPSHGPGSCRLPLVRVVRPAPTSTPDARAARPACGRCVRRSDFGAGLVNGESDDGGFDEFRLSCPSCRFSSATSPRSASTIILQVRHHRPKLRVLGGQLLIGRTTVGGHPSMINKT